MSTHNTSLQDILEIENDEAILNFRSPDTGDFLWPFIRNTLIRFIMSDLFFKTPITKRPFRLLASFPAIMKSEWHNFKKIPRLNTPILISATGSHIKKDNLYFNRLGDHFALALPQQTILMENLPINWMWPFPRHNKNVIFETPLKTWCALKTAMSSKTRYTELSLDLIDFIRDRAYSTLGWNLSENRRFFLAKTLSRHCASLPIRRLAWQRLFQRLGTKVLLRQLACYGGSSVINAVARDCGVITVEYQHGSISSGHDAYNFAEALCKNEIYKKTLPQYFLGYGKWWIEQISAPIEKIVIGNPYRTESIKNRNFNIKNKKNILVLGDGIQTSAYLDLSARLAHAFNERFNIIFRPHPAEQERIKSINSNNYHGVSISSCGDIYDAFTTSKIVISEVSTGLFEAIGLVDKIFLWNTPRSRFSLPCHSFTTFNNAEDLIKIINENNYGKIKSDIVEEIWATKWQENYIKFLSEICPHCLC